jgi:phage gp29-like protein
VAEIFWDTTEPGSWSPRLKVWDPRYLYWRWDTRSFWLITLDGQVEVTPGDGHWLLYCPDGYARGWMSGLVRSLALLFLIRRWATRDWARHSETLGQTIKKAVVPSEASPEDKAAFEADLRSLGAEGLVRVAKDANGNGFDFSLVEAASQSWDGFRQLIAMADECIAVDVLGQNLTTSMKAGGSYAAASIHDQIRRDRLESDARSLGDCLREQVVRPWTVWNYGDESLVPWTTWSTKAPEDRAGTAQIMNTLGDALTKLKSAGLNVDLEAVAKAFRIPLVENKPLVEAAEAPGAEEPQADEQAPADDEQPEPDQQAPEDTDAAPQQD